jgi:hypothetical protein
MHSMPLAEEHANAAEVDDVLAHQVNRPEAVADMNAIDESTHEGGTTPHPGEQDRSLHRE